MTDQEIFEQGSWIEDDGLGLSHYIIELLIPAFDEKIKIDTVNITKNSADSLKRHFLEVIDDIKIYEENHLSILKNEILEHYLQYKSNSDFSLKDESVESIYSLCKVEYIYVDMDFADNRYFSIVISCPWDTEHGISADYCNLRLDSIT